MNPLNPHAVVTHLRMDMKTQLLKTISSLPNPFAGTRFDKGGLMVAGSTVLTIARNLRYQFKTTAQKSGDLDLYMIPDPRDPQLFEDALRDRDAFQKLHKQVMPALLTSAFEKNGLRIVGGAAGKGFCTVEQTFPAHYSLGNSFGAEAVLTDPCAVRLEIEAGPETPVFLLPPQQWAPSPPGGTPLFVDHPLNLFSQKLTRAIKPTQHFKDSPYPEGFKVRDLMDIFNLADHRAPADRPPLFDLRQDQETLRTLMVVNFARFGIDPAYIDFSVYENPTPQDIQNLQTAIHERISDGIEVSEERAREMFSACAQSLRHAFPQSPKAGCIALTQREQSFIDKCNGLEGQGPASLTPCDPGPDASLLQAGAPAAFAQHPALAARIDGHPSLTAKAFSIRDRRANLGNFGE